MNQDIYDYIDLIEKQHGVEIIYACESGSRVWGFESPDSDYDLRFLYIQPLRNYLSVHEKRDVIEKPLTGKIDASGWDLKKALYLLSKGNPPLIEWLNSPKIYYQEFKIIDSMRTLAQMFWSPYSAVYHYFHMAKNNYNQYIKGRTDELWVKKYFYVLRPILCVKWIEEYNQFPPVKFNELVSLLPDSFLYNDVVNLVQSKQNGAELKTGKYIPSISNFLDGEIIRIDEYTKTMEFEKQSKRHGLIDDFFYEWAMEYGRQNINK